MVGAVVSSVRDAIDRNGRRGGISTLVRVALAAVWIVSGALKLSEPSQTKAAVEAYKLLPAGAVGWVAAALPLVELAVGLVVLIGFGTRVAAVLSVLGFAVLIGVIASVWVRGMKIDCGCFGGGGYDAKAGPGKYAMEILRDTGFLILAAWLIAYPRSFGALGPGSRVERRQLALQPLVNA